VSVQGSSAVVSAVAVVALGQRKMYLNGKRNLQGYILRIIYPPPSPLTPPLFKCLYLNGKGIYRDTY
jgi:hypothetical protein